MLKLLSRAVIASALVVVAAAGSQPPPQSDSIENAYRANNLGVARLEQFDYTAAADAFRNALRLSPSLALARVNLSIALFYALDVDGAQREAEEASRLLPRDPRPQYLLGLIARAQGRTDAAREAFERVRRIDPQDVGALINIGQIDLQQQRYADAIAAFRAAMAEEPYSVTATYNLGLALTRSGQRDEGQKAMERSQTLRAGGYGTIFSTNYLEQGRYAEAMASTGAEPDLVDPRVPDVKFVRTLITSTPDNFSGRGVALIDFDADGDPDLFVVWPGGVRLLRNDRGRFTDVTADAAPGGFDANVTQGGLDALAADYDNDGRIDLFLLRSGGNVLFHNNGNGKFSNATARATLPAYSGRATTAAFVDFDHDGDLDLVLGGDAPLQLVRNNGNGTFTDVTKQTGIDGAAHAIQIVPTDYDNRRDIDLLVVTTDKPPALFKNLRDGTFRDVAADAGLRIEEGRLWSVTAGDINKDDFPDFFFARNGLAGVFAMSDGRGRFTIAPGPPESVMAGAPQFVDYDNDGLLDLMTWSANGPRVFRHLSDSWMEVTAGAFGTGANSVWPVPTAGGIVSPNSVAFADIDRDGDMDVVAVGNGGVYLLRNDGANRSPSLRVTLTGRASNRSGIGSKIEMRSGSLRQRFERSAVTPAIAPAEILFGLGRRQRTDVVRVLWPSGILQAETMVDSPLAITELDRKPSSCPFLYTWNGRRFEFVTDFMGGGEMGYWEAPGIHNHPDPEEYVRIRDSQLQAKDGRYELRVTNELEETVFVDRLALIAVTHARNVEVFPNEGMTDPPKPFRLFQARDAHPPPRVTDDHGHDVTAQIMNLDGTSPDDFTLKQIRGYAAPHALRISLGRERPDLLLLTGWTDYAFSSDNVAAHQAGWTMAPPALEARGHDGAWRTIVNDIGIPVGRPQTIVVPLAGVLPAGAAEIRLVTNMRIYWDRIAIAALAHDRLTVTRLDPASAALRARGFSAEIGGGRSRPMLYDYDRVTRVSPWKTMVGSYTREGDVRPLVTRTDDRFVIAAPGDEIAVSFDASELPAVQAGFTRTFLLHADGFSKEMDLNSASPDAVDPLPFHGMPDYPYPPSARPSDTQAMKRYREEYNTRRIVRPLPPLDALRARVLSR